MWYFSWILGLGLACAFAILNAMWFELHADEQAQTRRRRAQSATLIRRSTAIFSVSPMRQGPNACDNCAALFLFPRRLSPWVADTR